MRIDHNGNVGIGTISPSSLLEVMAGSGDGITIKANAATPQDSGDLIFRDYDGTERARIHANQGNSTSHSLWFDINGSNRVMIGSTGNVGINTTTPQTKLDVNGEIKLASSGSACSTSNEGALRYNSTTKSLEFCNGTIWNSTSQSPAGTFCGSVSYDHLLGHNFNPKACGTSPPTDTTTLVNNCPSGYSLFRYFQADSNFGYTCVKL